MMPPSRTVQRASLLLLLLLYHADDTSAKLPLEQELWEINDCSPKCLALCNLTNLNHICSELLPCFCGENVNLRTKREIVKHQEVSKNELRGNSIDAALVFRLLGLSSATLCSGLIGVLYLANQMWAADCSAQIGEAVSLAAAHSCTILVATYGASLSQKHCWVVSLLLQFFYLSVFFFYIIEAVVIGRHLLKVFPECLFRSGWSVLIFCWGFSALLTIITAYTVYKEEEAQQNNCWFEFSAPWTWMTLGPVLVSFALQTVVLVPLFCVTEVPFKFGLEDALRAEVMLSSRWACAFTALLTYVAWFTGVTATNSHDPYWYVAAAVTDILLGVVILILRISTDFQLQARLMTLLKSTRPRSNRIDSWDAGHPSKTSTASTKAVSPVWAAPYSHKPILRY